MLVGDQPPGEGRRDAEGQELDLPLCAEAAQVGEIAACLRRLTRHLGGSRHHLFPGLRLRGLGRGEPVQRDACTNQRSRDNREDDHVHTRERQ